MFSAHRPRPISSTAVSRGPPDPPSVGPPGAPRSTPRGPMAVLDGRADAIGGGGDEQVQRQGPAWGGRGPSRSIPVIADSSLPRSVDVAGQRARKGCSSPKRVAVSAANGAVRGALGHGASSHVGDAQRFFCRSPLPELRISEALVCGRWRALCPRWPGIGGLANADAPIRLGCIGPARRAHAHGLWALAGCTRISPQHQQPLDH